MADTPTRENEELIREYYAAWDAGDPDEIAAFFADGFSTTYTDWMGNETSVGPGDVHDWIAGWLDVIADTTHEVHDLVADGDRVMAHVTYRGVHEGRIHGIEPTGNTVEVEEFLRFRIQDGGIVELDWLSDDLALLRQLGVDLPID
jgi:steroid delta-isomerase-like uncharacterized protein